jgi:hypothetical protein
VFFIHPEIQPTLGINAIFVFALTPNPSQKHAESER